MIKFHSSESFGVRLCAVGWQHRLLIAAVVALVILMTVAWRPRASDAIGFSPIEHVFAIKAQPMATALNEFSEQAGLQLLYGPDVVAGVDSSAVEGRLSSNEALRKLLRDSGLSYRLTGKDTVTIVKDIDADNKDAR